MNDWMAQRTRYLVGQCRECSRAFRFYAVQEYRILEDGAYEYQEIESWRIKKRCPGCTHMANARAHLRRHLVSLEKAKAWYRKHDDRKGKAKARKRKQKQKGDVA